MSEVMNTPINEATTMDQLQVRAQVLAERRARLGDMVQALNRGLEALKADHLPALRVAVSEAGVAWDGLRALIEANPQLFVKPRTVAVHGIKFGFEKGKGGLEIADADKTVKLIRKHLPEQADVLIATREVPAKDALAQLPADQLKRLGVNLKGTGDMVVIRPADGEVDKLVRALIKAATEDESAGNE